ncbi:hypothetical protein BRC64_06635 [Halobacteriales archaeon QH_10_67_22]|nr:MAG: hypothetical protein BRC64_06635 [Halobacteriales archaeon QH_10_67_22]
MPRGLTPCESKNTDGQTLRRHQVGVGDSESTPAETALPVDFLVKFAKCVVETGSLGVAGRLRLPG